MSISEPPRPVVDVKWIGVKFLTIKPIETAEFKVMKLSF